MTVKDVLDRVEKIRNKADVEHDDEVAHSMEDALHKEVLEAISLGEHEDAAPALALAALTTETIDFSRWCA